ncbi:MAG: 2-oxoacid:ferredoxin oxidoreductase subunit beta [Nitrosopumilaceae archaeon]|nr:2-oxoacid:ferredoxin oxidoreductase subunit beta [Nitrosopumilaceae archaeon]
MANNISDYKTDIHNDWCAGCGDFGILNSIQMALCELNIANHNAVIFSGIGCSGKTPHFINTYGIHTIHGRVLPFAQGAKISNPQITVIALGGDGDGLGIGAGHFVAAGRRNVDMTYIIFNNGVYGLTKGQPSPTLSQGIKTKNSINKNINCSINPIELAIVTGFTFVARGHSFDIQHLKNLIISAISHKGLSFIDVIQPCPTYNDDMHTVNSANTFSSQSYYKLNQSTYDPIISDRDNKLTQYEKLNKILIKSHEFGHKIPIGVFYQNNIISSYQDRLNDITISHKNISPASTKISDSNHNPSTDISNLIDEIILK